MKHNLYSQERDILSCEKSVKYLYFSDMPFDEINYVYIYIYIYIYLYLNNLFFI